jgi:hypothetical protein
MVWAELGVFRLALRDDQKAWNCLRTQQKWSEIGYSKQPPVSLLRIGNFEHRMSTAYTRIRLAVVGSHPAHRVEHSEAD